VTACSGHGLVDGVDKIAVLRPNAVGDFVFALPALHALKAAYPKAELVLIGKAWHRDFLAGRQGPVDRVAELPPVPGVGVPVDARVGDAATAAFVDRMRGERFDLALQMFGGGRYSNPFLARLGARLTAGWRGPGAPALDRWIAYREPMPRRLALLEIAGLIGAWPGPLALPELSLTEADRQEAAALLPALPGERLVVLQPGSTDPRRCWPAQRFVALGDMLAAMGMRILVNGSPDEAALVEAVVGRMRHPATALAGKLGLGGLCALLARAALVVSNDTGPLHLALALGVPSVGIFWLTNALEGMPLHPSLLHLAVASTTRCSVCGQDNLENRCVHDPSFVDDVSLEQVAALARTALAPLHTHTQANGSASAVGGH
jgi:ADP-heptose:LPS heptosyltransferase